MEFRPLKQSDKADFIVMSEEFYHSSAVLHPVPAAYHETAFAEMMRSSDYLQGYLFLWENRPAGFAVTNNMMQHEAGGLVVWVEELFVRAQYRSRGLGSAFLRWLELQLQGKAVQIRLETEPENTRARALYASLGFEDLPYQQLILKLK